MKFKNLLIGKQFVWKGDLYIKLKNPATEPCQWSSTGTRSLNAVKLSGYSTGKLCGFNAKSSNNDFTQIKN